MRRNRASAGWYYGTLQLSAREVNKKWVTILSKTGFRITPGIHAADY